MPSAKSSGARLTEGSISRHLRSLTVPMTFGILSMVSKNLVDTYFVAQLGTEALSAISFTFPVVMLLMSFSVGLGAGASSVVSRILGSGDPAKVQRSSTDALVLSVLLVAILCVVGLASLRPLFSALGARGPVLELVIAYMQPWFVGLMFLVVPMLGNSLCRAAGEGTWPGLIMVSAAAINAILDPFLIFGWAGLPELGIAGASTATVVSNLCATLGSLWLLRREDLLTMRIPSPSEAWASWKPMLAIGLPASGANMVNPLGITLVTAMLARISDTAVAGFGVAGRLEGLSLLTMLALSAAIGPIVGQNVGAKRFDRVREAMQVSFRVCIRIGMVTAALLAVLGPWVTPLFDGSVDVRSTANLYLWLVPVSFAGYGINIVQAAAFNAVGRPSLAAGLTVARMFGVYLPAAWIGMMVTGEPAGVFVGAVVGNVAGGLLGWLGSRSMMRRLQREGSCRDPFYRNEPTKSEERSPVADWDLAERPANPAKPGV